MALTTASHAIALTQIAAALREKWDPRILEESHRLDDATKFWQPRTQPWEQGTKRLHIRVRHKMLRSTRALGNIATANTTGTTFRNPPQTLGYTTWQIGQDDLMSYQCPVQYRFKTNEIIGAAEIGPISETLARDSLADVTERLGIALVTTQTGALGHVAKITSELVSYSATWVPASTHARLHLKDGGAARFQVGDKIHLISSEGSYMAAPAATLTEPSTQVEVTGVNYGRGATGVYGSIDVKAGAGSTFYEASVAPSSQYILLSDEYDSSIKPGANPIDAANATNIYGCQDWFRAHGSTAGVIFNHTRTGSGEGWTCPIVDTKSSQSVITLADIDELLACVYQKRLQDPKMTEWVILTGFRLAQTLTTLTGAANRRMDETGVAKTAINTHYGFNGVMIHNHALQSAVAVQGIRGMSEDALYLVQPGVLNLIEPGGVQWLPWTGGGEVWMNLQDGSGNRTDIYRADRHIMLNSLIELPRMCGAITNVKPD